MTDIEEIREAIMRLSMCAIRECELCKYKDCPEKDLPSDECKARSIENVSILVNEFLRERPFKCKECRWMAYGKEGSPICTAYDGMCSIVEDSFCSCFKRRKEK